MLNNNRIPLECYQCDIFASIGAEVISKFKYTYVKAQDPNCYTANSYLYHPNLTLPRNIINFAPSALVFPARKLKAKVDSRSFECHA